MAIRKIVPSDKPAAFNKIKKLNPNIPANPVLEEKNPTHFDGNPFKNPRVFKYTRLIEKPVHN